MSVAVDPGSKLWESVREWIATGMAFLIGVLASFKFEFVGALGYHELLLIAITPFVLPKIIRSRSIRRHRVVLILGLLYLGSQIFSDLYRHTVPQDYLRGWARIGLTLLAFCIATALFVRSSKAMLGYFIGAFLVGPITFIQTGIVPDDEQAYKLSLGSAVSLASFLFVCVAPGRLKLPAAFMPIIAGVIALWRGGRSLAGITILATVAYWAGRLKSESRRKISRKKIGLVLAVFALTGWGILELYRYTASAGLLGESALAKFEDQSQKLASGNIGLLLSGRLELLYAGPKILVSPIIGYGSWVKDVDYVFNRALELGLDPEEAIASVEAEPGLIPTHSHIFASWLEGGLAGACFWGFAAFITVNVLIKQKFTRHPHLAPLANYVLVYFFWDIFFSPYSGDRRVWSGVVIAWIASIYYTSKRSAKTSDGSA